jgi:anti-anti-sigma factor
MVDVSDSSGPIARIETSCDALGVPTVAVSGELDISNVSALRSRLDPILDSDPKRLVFDLDGLTFMDSSGISVLLNAAGRVPVRLRHVSRAVRMVIEVTGLDEILPMET